MVFLRRVCRLFHEIFLFQMHIILKKLEGEK